MCISQQDGDEMMGYDLQVEALMVSFLLNISFFLIFMLLVLFIA